MYVCVCSQSGAINLIVCLCRHVHSIVQTGLLARVLCFCVRALQKASTLSIQSQNARARVLHLVRVELQGAQTLYVSEVAIFALHTSVLCLKCEVIASTFSFRLECDMRLSRGPSPALSVVRINISWRARMSLFCL